ncbi:hypothetical protein EV184_102447 [Sinorhizobium americanum]|uniref:Uncharacterized protein n=1 Tax=Sinorhizobium americanum TaxID=194963 RepID=A0A4R2C389_9HYPH|nr:hypothetical protein EV184_102447 [Sinorhizobium americanum]
MKATLGLSKVGLATQQVNDIIDRLNPLYARSGSAH